MAQELVTSMVGKVVDTLFGVAKKEISYMSNCSEYIKDLNEKIEDLTLMKGSVVEQIAAANEKGDRLKEGVENWVKNAEFLITEAKKIIQGVNTESHIPEAKEVTDGANAESHISEAKQVTGGANAESHISEAKEDIDGVDAIANKTCFNLGMCTHLVTLYSHGKKAANKIASLEKILEAGARFESRVSVDTPAPGDLDVYERHNMDGLDTHKLCIEKIIKSVKDDNIQIIGIYGTGGVGKTTLAKEVAVKRTVKRLFAGVEFITVSQPVDAQRIKKDVENAAKRIKNGDKILVILDDLWGELKLDEVGIPCGADYKNCKILLTSRSKDVCKTMNATCLICVDSLLTKEAWILFKRVVGDTVETDAKLKKIAEKIVEGCGGLPLIIQAVGAALKNESIESWKRALTQLKKPTTSYIDPKISLAYSHLQLSFDLLESEEAKLCFLLCSMFPEDSNIPLERLAYYGVGLEIFTDLDSMEDVRNGVRHAVKILKSSCLLLDGKHESTVKMHDVVREVALLIASKGSNKFLVKAGIGLTEWQPRNKSVKSCTGISLMYNGIRKLPDYELDIPLLDIFLIQENCLPTIPDKFIQGVKEARVLDFGRNEIVSLPPSLFMKQLTKLCMLNLGGNKNLRDISVLGDLILLEILILSHTGIVKIPQEIGNLVNLRRLEVKGCLGLSHIAPSVMSKLRWLEELHLAYYPVKDGNNEGLMEIGKLSMLTFLDLFVPQIHLIPEGVCFTKLKGFVIQIGGPTQIYDVAEVVHKKTLILGMKDLDTPSMLQVKELIELSDGIIFNSVDNPNNIVPTMYCESLDDLTTIMLCRCRNLLSLVEYSSDWDVDEELGEENTKKQFFSKLEHLVLFKLNELCVLWNCPDQYISLKNLVTLHICGCNKLVRLFSVKAARGLVNLQTLTIQECSSLEEVIWDGDRGNIDMVDFPCLVKIELYYLKNLKSFYAGNVKISYPSLEKMEIYECNVMDKWNNNGTYHTPNLKPVNRVWILPCICTC
ncbi:NB-ARC domains-containing protein [Tanacetum coccineum]